jgi:hypothetical protein
MNNWKEEIKEMLSITNDNLNLHYEFVLIIGELLEKNDFKVDQILLMHDVLKSEEPSTHLVYMTLVHNTNTIDLSFPFGNDFFGPQRFTVDVVKIDEVTISNFMGINIYKDVFNDSNKYFDTILINTILNLIKILDENGIF